MKKLILYSLFLMLSACSITDAFTELNVDNKNCIGVRRFKVIRADYLNSAFAYECYTSDCSDWYKNTLDFILVGMGEKELYDDMIYEVPNDRCAVRNGVFKYETKDGHMKTVSQVVFEYKNDYKSEEEHQNRIYKAKESMYKMCLYLFKNEELEVDDEYCACYGNSHIENSGNSKAIEEECGKMPKFLPTK